MNWRWDDLLQYFWVFKLIIFYFGERRACHIFIKIITDLWDSLISFMSVIQNWLSTQSIFITQTLYQMETF